MPFKAPNALRWPYIQPGSIPTACIMLGTLNSHLPPSWATLLGECVNIKSEAHSGNEANADTIAIGTMPF